MMSASVPRAEWLCLDFNCAMYYVLHRQPAWTAETNTAWESAFCKDIANYMKEIIAVAQPSVGVYVSCDGVVCAAKRRQQRLRRFKGPWIARYEGVDPLTKWDQNALTPGSVFMDKLAVVLKQVSLPSLKIVVSATDEPGEGEHKLMTYMRALKPASCVIYGLDADLILLAMLLDSKVHLLREAQEFEKSASGWRSLDIQALRTVMLGHESRSVIDYVTAMSLLGNDFLPKSLTHTVRDDGIPNLIRSLRQPLVVDGQIQKDALLAIVETMAEEEESAMLQTCLSAIKARHRIKEWPAAQATILQLYQSKTGRLRTDWRTIYRERFAAGSSATDYCAGLAWTLDYYMGKPVDLGWNYDHHLPPLWSDIATYLRSVTTVQSPPLVHTTYLPPWLHLLSVLPADSVHRLLPVRYHGLMKAKPWYWPSQFAFFDVGRSMMWECEVVIPVFLEETLRQINMTTKPPAKLKA